MYAYIFGNLTSMGVDVAGESQLVGYPTQFPGVTMIDWTTGKPNARYWVLKLLRDNFGPGNRLVASDFLATLRCIRWRLAWLRRWQTPLAARK